MRRELDEARRERDEARAERDALQRQLHDAGGAINQPQRHDEDDAEGKSASAMTLCVSAANHARRLAGLPALERQA